MNNSKNFNPDELIISMRHFLQDLVTPFFVESKQKIQPLMFVVVGNIAFELVTYAKV